MDSLSEKEVLNFALANGIINIDTIQKQIEMNERKKYLEMHTTKVWQGENGKWYTYLSDDKNTRRLIKKSTREAINDCIVEHYKSFEHEPTFADAFNQWLESKVAYGEIQRQTYDRYKTDFIRYIESDNIGKCKMKYVTEDMLETFIKSTIHEKQLTAKRWAGLRLIITGTFKYAKKKGYTQISITNFLGDLELSRKAFTRRSFTDKESVFTDAELDLVVGYIASKEPSIINLGILLAFQTGLRVGELAALKWSDIRGNIINVNKTEIRYKSGNGTYIYEIRESAKTEAGNRELIISQSAVKTLKAIRLLNPFGEFVFTKNGERIKEKAFSVKIVKICKYVKIPPRSLHKARKTYATKLLNAGVDERLVINQMGHTDISTTKHFYYFNNKDEEEAREQIQRALNY